MTELKPVSFKQKNKLRSVTIIIIFLMVITIISYIPGILFHSKKTPEVKPAKPTVQIKPNIRQTAPAGQNPPRVQPAIQTKAKRAAAEVTDINNSPAIDRYLNSLHFNGSALVVKNNHILINKGYGFADFQKKLLNNSNAIFYIGSITKVFISTAVMQLQEQGKLNINDPVSKYIPEFPNGRNIKLYHLLTHTSGIPEHDETDQPISHEELIRKIEKGRLMFAPGTAWDYSDSNYTLLAYIAEKVSGEPFDSYVKGHIFDKAGLTHTGFGLAPANEVYVPIGYKMKDHAMHAASLPDMTELFGCGDVYTTPYDMYLFDMALYNGVFFSPAYFKEFFTPFKHHYAFGIYNDPGSYSDHGVLPGWNSLNSFSKNGSEYVVLLSNVQNNVKLGVANNEIYIMMSNMIEK